MRRRSRTTCRPTDTKHPQRLAPIERGVDTRGLGARIGADGDEIFGGADSRQPFAHGRRHIGRRPDDALKDVDGRIAIALREIA
jgi:hypothetical protein